MSDRDELDDVAAKDLARFAVTDAGRCPICGFGATALQIMAGTLNIWAACEDCGSAWMVDDPGHRRAAFLLRGSAA